MMKILDLWKGTNDSLMKKVYALGLALFLFSLTILFMGSMAQFYMELVTIRPGVVETAGLSPSPAYFRGGNPPTESIACFGCTPAVWFF